TVVSTVVSAETLSERSITPTSAAINATGVEYTVRFTPEVTAGAVVLDFGNSASGPLLGQMWTGPKAIDVGGACAAKPGVAIVDKTANKIVATKTMTADVAEEISFTAIDNPSTTGVSYARIATFDDSADALGYVSDNPDAVGPVIDSGSV